MGTNSSQRFKFLLFILAFVVAIQGYFIYDLKTNNVSNVATNSNETVGLIADDNLEVKKVVSNINDNSKIEKKEQKEELVQNVKSEHTIHDPFVEIRKMQDEMMRSFASFNSMFANDPFFKDSFSSMSFAPLSDLKEQKDKYIVTLEIPGVEEKDIKIEAKDHLLSINATSQKNTDKKDTNYIQKERYVQSFSRIFTLPNDANIDKLTSKYSKGILNITIPKNKPKTQK